MRTVLKYLLLVVIGPVALLAIGLTSLMISSHRQTEDRIFSALQSGFEHDKIVVNERRDRGREFFNGICFDLTIQAHPGATKPSNKWVQGDDDDEDWNFSNRRYRSIVMVQGDEDGGTWALSDRRYRSIQACEADFYRG